MGYRFSKHKMTIYPKNWWGTPIHIYIPPKFSSGQMCLWSDDVGEILGWVNSLSAKLEDHAQVGSSPQSKERNHQHGSDSEDFSTNGDQKHTTTLSLPSQQLLFPVVDKTTLSPINPLKTFISSTKQRFYKKLLIRLLPGVFTRVDNTTHRVSFELQVAEKPKQRARIKNITKQFVISRTKFKTWMYVDDIETEY